MGQFCHIKFSREPRITFQISWRAESESGYVWTSKFDLTTTCEGENFWIHKEKVQVQIKKNPDTSERTGTREALGKMLKFTIATSQERMVSFSLVRHHWQVGRWIGRYVGSNCKNVYFERAARKYKVKQNRHPQYSYLQ